MTKSISARQLSLIGFISAVSLKLTILPSLLFERSGVDALFSLLILTAIDFLEFGLIYYVLKRNQNIGLYQFLCNGVGKFLAKVVLFIIFVFYFFKMLTLSSGGYDYARLAIFKEAPFYLFLFIILVSSSSLVLFKSKSYGRTVEFCYPIVAFMFILFLSISIFTAPLQDIRPLFTHSFTNILNTSFSFGLIGGNFIFMLLFMGKIKFGKKNTGTLLGHIVFGQLILFAFYLINYSIFKYTAIAHPHSISEIIQFLPLPSVLGNFDWFAVSVMLLLFTLQGGLFLLCMTYLATNVVEFKKIKHKDWLPKVCLLFINILIIVFLYTIFPNFPSLRVFIFNKPYIPILCLVVYALVVIVFVLELVKRKKGKKKISTVKQEDKSLEPASVKLNVFTFKGGNYEKDF